MARANAVTLQKRSVTPNYTAWCLPVPAAVMAQIPDAKRNTIFSCELTEDGLLYRRLADAPSGDAPRWVSA